MCICSCLYLIVTQDPLLLITSLEDESNVRIKVNFEQGEIDSLQSELLIKRQQVLQMKEVEQRLGQSKLMLNKKQRKLSNDIEMLTSSQSELCSAYTVKLDSIEKKITNIIEILSSLQLMLTLLHCILLLHILLCLSVCVELNYLV